MTALTLSGYLRVRSMNSIETWSAVPVHIGLNTLYDFTDSPSKVYGDNLKEVEPGVWSIFSGDINQDLYVDAFDGQILQVDNLDFLFGYYASDLNGDGYVDSFDNPICELNNLMFVATMRP